MISDGVAWFLESPFASPPVGELRWRPPGAPPHWTGERDATKAGPVCPAQEDCLYLNLLRPASAHAGPKLPVMVWIHGGAFLGGTSMAGYGGDTDGHEFARDGIVAVSANYRIGFAGYFSHPALDRENHPHSNYGAMESDRTPGPSPALRTAEALKKRDYPWQADAPAARASDRDRRLGAALDERREELGGPL